jgi:hypothetical protein
MKENTIARCHQMSNISEIRRAKDQFMAQDHDSPLTDEQRLGFRGLIYYVENPDLRFKLDIEPFETQETVEIQTSTGSVAAFTRWGRLSFGVNGTPAHLTVYRDVESGGYFLPFADSTSGEETYGAGRYLEIETLPDGASLVDFNYAYNPYCAYSERWSCPLTPS